MPKVETNREPTEADRQAVRKFLYAMPLLERGAPLLTELLWVLLGRPGEDSHPKILPDYCYHIFDALQRTFFKGVPQIHDTVLVMDQASRRRAWLTAR